MKSSALRQISQFLPLCGLLFLGATTQNDILTHVARAAEVAWGEWQPLDDKAQKSIDWRTSQADNSAAPGSSQWGYQFRNRYPKKVKFQSTLTYQDENGVERTEIKVWTLDSQETGSAVLKGKKLGTVKITRLEMLNPAGAVPPPGTGATVPQPSIKPRKRVKPVVQILPEEEEEPEPSVATVPQPSQKPQKRVKPEVQILPEEESKPSAEARVQQAEARAREAEARAQQAEARAREAEARARQATEVTNGEASPRTAAAPRTTPQESNQSASEPARTLSGETWRLEPEKLEEAHSNSVSALAYSPDGTLLASCSWRLNGSAPVGEISLRDTATKQTLRRLEGRWETAWKGAGPKPPWIGHWSKINEVVFSPDGALLASGGEDGRVTLWNVKSGNATKALPKLERPIIALSWTSPDTLYGLSRDGKIAVWDIASNKVRVSPLGTSSSGDWVRVGAFSNDGQRLATGDTNGGITLWNLPGASMVRKFNNSVYQSLEHPGGVEATALAFTPDSKSLLSANQAHIYMNAVEKAAGTNEYNTKVLFAGQRVRQIVFAPDGETAAAVCETKVLIVNPRAKSGAQAQVREIPSEGTPILEIAVSSQQNTFASGGAAGNVVLWK